MEDDAHPYCAAEHCFVHLYCTQCTLCNRMYCSEHIPIGNHKCGSESSGGGAGSAALHPSGSGGADAPTSLLPRMRSSTRSSGNYRRTRSRELMEPQSPPQGAAAGGSGGVDPSELLASPDLVKRLSSNSPLSLGMMRRSSSLLSRGGAGGASNNGLPPSFSRTPSGAAVGVSGSGVHGGTGGASLPRGLSNMFASPTHGAMAHGADREASVEWMRGTSIPPASSDALPHPAHQLQLLHSHSGESVGSPFGGGGTVPRRHPGGVLASPLRGSHDSASSPVPPEAKLTRLRSRELSGLNAYSHMLRGDEQARDDAAAAASGGGEPSHAPRAGLKRKASQLRANSPQQLQQQQAQFAQDTLHMPPALPQVGPRGGKKGSRANSQIQKQQQQQQDLLPSPPPPQVPQMQIQLQHEGAPLPASDAWQQQQLMYGNASPATSAAAASLLHPMLNYTHTQPLPPASMMAMSSPRGGMDHVTPSFESPDPRSLAHAYEQECARMETVCRLLAHWVPTSAPAAAAAQQQADGSSTAPHVNGSHEAADELVRSFQHATLTFRRDILQQHGGIEDFTRRQRLCEGIVTLSLTHGERAHDTAAAAAHSRSHSPAGGVPPAVHGGFAGGGAGGVTQLSSFRIPASNQPHPLLHTLSRAVSLVVDALLMNELELALFSVYLERLCPDWACTVERGLAAAATPGEVHNIRALHYTAYLVKLTLSDGAGSPAASSLLHAQAPGSGTPTDPLLAYLTGLWPDFALRFSRWLHGKGIKSIAVPPPALNARFVTLQAYVAQTAARAGTTQ